MRSAESTVGAERSGAQQSAMAALSPTYTALTLLLLYVAAFTLVSSKKPNVVLILTDDQDVLLGGMVSPG